MRVKLKLFFRWGIRFSGEFSLPQAESRQVHYASGDQLLQAVMRKYRPQFSSADPGTREDDHFPYSDYTEKGTKLITHRPKEDSYE